MHRLFDSHIIGLLDRNKPKQIMEIGVLRGKNTLRLLEWCSANDARLTSLDPVAWEGNLPEKIKRPLDGYKYNRVRSDEPVIVPVDVEEIYARGLESNWDCVKQRSLDYLSSPEFKGADMFLIDGDHNYFTVSEELRLIHLNGKVGDVLLFHDVAGVWARRDLYYDPEFIPEDQQNGQRQGVLLAIRDFLDSVSERGWLGRRRNCPYNFKILTRRKDGLGQLERRMP